MTLQPLQPAAYAEPVVAKRVGCDAAGRALPSSSSRAEDPTAKKVGKAHESRSSDTSREPDPVEAPAPETIEIDLPDAPEVKTVSEVTSPWIRRFGEDYKGNLFNFG